jgi:hypothetical protein
MMGLFLYVKLKESLRLVIILMDIKTDVHTRGIQGVFV